MAKSRSNRTAHLGSNYSPEGIDGLPDLLIS